MFWAYFFYDKKGPCYIWSKKIDLEKKVIQKKLDKWNEENEKRLKKEWKLTIALRRINLNRNPGGKKLVWKFIEKRGKRVRKVKAGGIDWYRYGEIIFRKKFLSFTRECFHDRIDTII